MVNENNPSYKINVIFITIGVMIAWGLYTITMYTRLFIFHFSPIVKILHIFYKVTCGPRLMKHATFQVVPHLKSAFEAYGHLLTGVTSQPVGDFLYTLCRFFCHSCLFNSKIDMCAFLFASVSLIMGCSTFCIVSSLMLKRCLLHV